jgi:hypothetical protein
VTWGSDFQGTYEELHDGLSAPGRVAVETALAGLVVGVGVAVLVWGIRRGAIAATVTVQVVVLVALALMAAPRLLLPSRARSALPSEASGDCCSYPGPRSTWRTQRWPARPGCSSWWWSGPSSPSG